MASKDKPTPRGDPKSKITEKSSPVTKYEALLLELAGPGLSEERISCIFQILDQLQPHMGVFTQIMKRIRDELFDAVYSDHYTGTTLCEPQAARYIQRVPHFTLIKRVYDERDARAEQLQEQLSIVKKRLFEKQKEYEGSLETIATQYGKVGELEFQIASLEAQLTEKKVNIRRLDDELAEQQEMTDKMEYDMKCDISDLQEELEEVQTEAAYLRQYKTGYVELEASFVGKGYTFEDIIPRKKKKSVVATKRAHFISGIESAVRMEEQILTVQNSVMEEFDKYMEDHKRELIEKRLDDSMDIDQYDTQQADLERADQQLLVMQGRFQRSMDEMRTEVELLTQHKAMLQEQLQTLQESRPQARYTRSSYSKKSRRHTRENILGESRPETRESGMSTAADDEPEEDPNVDPFVPQERIFSKYAAMMYTSDNNGKSFHEFKDARYCSSCGEKSVLCPHKILSQEHVFPLPPGSTHLKIARPKVRINQQMIDYPNWKPFKGKHEIKYITNTDERRRKRWYRRRTLWQKSYELATICRGKIFMLFVDDNNQGWVYSSNEELYEKYTTTGLRHEKDDWRYNEDNQRIDKNNHNNSDNRNDSTNMNDSNNHHDSDNCNNSNNRVDNRLVVPSPTKESPLEMSFAREVAALDLNASQSSDTSVPVLPSDLENLELRDRMSTPRILRITEVPMCDPNVSCITDNQPLQYHELTAAPQNAQQYHQMTTVPTFARQLQFDNQPMGSHPTQQYIQQTAATQPTQQYLQQTATTQPTQQYLQQTATTQPTQQYLQQTPAALPTQQYLQQTVATQPMQQYLQQTAATQPTQQYLQQTPAALPTQQYLQQTVATQPTQQYLQQTATTQPTQQYLQQTAAAQPVQQYHQQTPAALPTQQCLKQMATAQRVEQYLQEIVSPLPVQLQPHLDNRDPHPETEMNQPFPQSKTQPLAPSSELQMDKHELAAPSGPQVDKQDSPHQEQQPEECQLLSAQLHQTSPKPPSRGKNVHSFYAREPKKPLKRKLIPTVYKSSPPRKRTRSNRLRSSPFNKIMASVINSRKAKKCKEM